MRAAVKQNAKMPAMRRFGAEQVRQMVMASGMKCECIGGKPFGCLRFLGGNIPQIVDSFHPHMDDSSRSR